MKIFNIDVVDHYQNVHVYVESLEVSLSSLRVYFSTSTGINLW